MSDKIKGLNQFKFCYAVNVDLQAGQDFGTFFAVSKDKQTGRFQTNLFGASMGQVYLYYTDKRVEDEMTDQAMHFALVMDLIEGRKFARDEGAIVIGVNKEDPADKIREMLEKMGGREVMDKASLVNEALMAAKAGADTSMYAEMLK